MRIGMICLLFVFSASLGSAETSVTVGGGSYWSSLPAPSPFLFTKVDNKYAEAFDPFDGDWQPGPLVTVSRGLSRWNPSSRSARLCHVDRSDADH